MLQDYGLWGRPMKYLAAVLKEFVDIGGRQFFLCICSWTGSTVLFAAGTLSEGGYLSLCAGTVVAYIAGNQVQHYNDRKAENGEVTP